MITGTLKTKVDKLWDDFWSGGIANPLSVIEQISYLMFARMLDLREMKNEKRAKQLNKKNWNRLFPANKQHLRWGSLCHEKAERQLQIVQQELFPFFREEVVAESTLGRYLKDAQCIIQKPSLLKTAINTISELPLTQGDTKGDLYEYMLSKLSTAGVAGQFRTPRHVIRAMVELVDVKPTDTVCDPACGTAGFLIEAMDYLRRTHSSPELVHDEIDDLTGEPVKDDHGQPVKVYPGDQLEEYRKHIEQDMFHGFDFDNTMLRIAAMNMLLHGIEAPAIEHQDSLADGFDTKFPEYYADAFDVILANPPFKGSIDDSTIDKTLSAVAKTKKTELLFLVLMLRMLKLGGRCAVIVPDGVLFGSSGAHQAVRQQLIDHNQLEAVISLPSGVFKPYAGVSTAILLFTKGGQTGHVWFYKVDNDGYSLDDKRTPIDGSDLPDLVEQWKKWSTPKKRPLKQFEARTGKAFAVPKQEITDQKYDLSFNRYHAPEYEETSYDPPKKILKQLRKLENEILRDIDELEKMLG